MNPKLIRVASVAMSLDILLKGQLAFLNQYFNVIAVSGSDKHLENVKNREGVATVNLPMKREIAPISDLISLIKLFFLFRKEKPQIVHSITPKAGLLSMIAAKYARVPIRIHTFTGLVFPSKTGFMQKLLIFMDKVLCSHATHIYPEGNGVKNDLIQYKITNKSLNIIANGNVNGVDTEYFNTNNIHTDDKENLKKSLAIASSDFVFIFVGRLVKDKGINELINAFENLSKTNQNIKLLLVGSFENDLDPLEKKTIGLIETNKNIIAVGFQNDVRAYFAISDALVFPSYREGFPNVVLQAGAMNLPSIVTNINGCNEIVIQNINGLIIPAKDQNAIYEGMQELMQNTELKNRLKQNARKIILDKFEQKIVWNELLNQYNTIVLQQKA